MTPEQGDDLTTILDDYHKQLLILDSYQRDNPVGQAIQKGQHVPEHYSDAQREITNIEARWGTLQRAIDQRFYSAS